MTLTTLIFIEVCVLLVQAFFSGSEMAIISADKLALRKQANKGSAGAKLALHLSSHPEHVLSTVILGTNICVTLQATLVTLFIFHHYGPHYEIYATLVLSPIVLIFGELIPKTLFQRYSEFIAPRVARPVQIVRNIFSPIIWFIEKYAFAVSRCVVPLQEKFSDKVKTNHREEDQR